MITPFEERMALKQAAREMCASLAWKDNVRFIQRMKDQFASWEKSTKNSIASKPRA